MTEKAQKAELSGGGHSPILDLHALQFLRELVSTPEGFTEVQSQSFKPLRLLAHLLSGHFYW